LNSDRKQMISGRSWKGLGNVLGPHWDDFKSILKTTHTAGNNKEFPRIFSKH